MTKDEHVESRALDLSDLSHEELHIVQRIEKQLKQVRQEQVASEPAFGSNHWARADEKFPRVILLDGDRGTGKTSLMLTLAERWKREASKGCSKKAGLQSEDSESSVALSEVKRQKVIKELRGDVPRNIYTLPILDFDSLPPSMPVIAGIVQAWRPLADSYAHSPTERRSDHFSIQDEWHNLFQTAAAGWGGVSERRNLIDQVLDQEEQVKDWQSLSWKWQSFVRKVSAAGRAMPEEIALCQNPVFVIMIDDCDLQVERLTELLPAVRLLYSYNVFFLLSAHRRHLHDMLQLGLTGRQNALGRSQGFGNSPNDALIEKWAQTLSRATIEKVFPIASRHRLSRLGLSEYLEYPYADPAEKIGVRFEGWSRLHQQASRAEDPTDLLGYLKAAAADLDDLELAFPIATYRTAKQAWDADQSAIEGESKPPEDSWESQTRQAEAIARMIGGTRYDDLVKIQRVDPDPGGIAESHAGTNTAEAGPTKPAASRPRIRYLTTGRLEAFFSQELSEPLSIGASIQLSASPAFWKGEIGDRRIVSDEISQDMAQALLAVSLQDDGFGVNAPSLQWEIRLGLAWTQHSFPERLAFAWPMYEHPSPARLIKWAKEWGVFLDRLRQLSGAKTERMAYAWLYYQLKWCESQVDLPDPCDPGVTVEALINPDREGGPWLQLVKAIPINEASRRQWRENVLPLMARPELGLPREIQEFLLANSDAAKAISTLQIARERFITDAFITARVLRGEEIGNEEADALIKGLRVGFDKSHARIYEERSSAWESLIGPPRES